MKFSAGAFQSRWSILELGLLLGILPGGGVVFGVLSNARLDSSKETSVYERVHNLAVEIEEEGAHTDVNLAKLNERR